MIQRSISYEPYYIGDHTSDWLYQTHAGHYMDLYDMDPYSPEDIEHDDVT